MNTGWLHAVTIICHTLVLIAIIAAVVVLAGGRLLDTNAIAFLATLGGVTGSGLVINGRKVGQNDRRDPDR